MKIPVIIVSSILLFLFTERVLATEGCLVSNTFYTSYLGMVRLSNNPEIIGDRKVFNDSGNQYSINYSGSESCFTVAVNKYGNGSPDRGGPACFIMSAGTYNSLPASGTPGTRVANYYPNPTGSLQDFTISCMITPLPLDDYLPVCLLLVGGFGAMFIRKNLFNQIQIN